MKKIFAALVCAMPFVANAEGIYMGLGYGQAEIDLELTNISGASLSGDDNTSKVFVGYDINDTFAVEGFYINDISNSLVGAGSTWTNAAGRAGSMPSGITELKAELSDIYGISVIGGVEVASDLRLLGKVGYYYWDYDVYADGARSTREIDDGSDMMYGVGLEYGINEQMSLRAEYEKYDGDKTKLRRATSFDIYSSNLVYRF